MFVAAFSHMKHLFSPLLLGILYIFICPFTKVEESFNMHAIFDIVNNSSTWDHHIYPGPVHRTFVGNLILGILAYVPCNAVRLFYNGIYLGIIQQTIVRITLYLVNIFILHIFSNRLLPVKSNFLLITGTQFHLPYYLSRTIPNSFAFPLVMLGLTDWISSLYDAKYTRNAIRLIIYAAVILRCEAGSLLLCVLLLNKIQNRPTLVFAGIIIYDITIAMAITIVTDSYFWGVLTWPELSGFVYNVVFNKSSNWGSSPFYQYAIEVAKICNVSLLLIPFSFNKQISFKIIFFILFVLVLMSFVSHKEWRFIMYLFPLINALSAIGMQQVHDKLGKYGKFVYFVPMGQFLVSVVFVYISSFNYPGGYAGISFAANKVIQTPIQLWKNVAFDILSPAKQIDKTVWIDFGTKQTGTTLFVYPKYEKIDIKDIQPPFYLSWNAWDLEIERINVPDAKLEAEFILTTESNKLNKIWCIKGLSSVGLKCPWLVCTDYKSCLYEQKK